jgi:hypothetical protein
MVKVLPIAQPGEKIWGRLAKTVSIFQPLNGLPGFETEQFYLMRHGGNILLRFMIIITKLRGNFAIDRIIKTCKLR